VRPGETAAGDGAADTAVEGAAAETTAEDGATTTAEDGAAGSEPARAASLPRRQTGVAPASTVEAGHGGPAAQASAPPTDPRGRSPHPNHRSHRTRARLLAAGLVLLAAAAAVLIVVDPFGGSGSASGVADNSSPTTLDTVVRRSLSSRQSENGTLGYAGSYSIINQARGTITALPAVGQVIALGHVLYRVANAPVVLLYGHTPAYRALSKGLEGPDVRELNTDLVALGYASGEAL
jgi:hypothetical protein